VSHFRLAAHLGLALAIFGALWWTILDLKYHEREGKQKERDGIFAHAHLAFILLAFTIVWGAFTAGLDAGLVYNTFPLMDGRFIPSGAPDILHDHGWVQFTHRWLAKATGLIILALAWRTKSAALAAMVLIQIGLGIITVLGGVPVWLGALHQAGGIILLALMLASLHKIRGRWSSSPHLVQ
jgi:cytochrome c oxidase assembly protein subunit 15